MKISFDVDSEIMRACFGDPPHDPNSLITDDEWFDACARGRLENYLSKYSQGPVLGEPTHQGLIDRASAAKVKLREDALAEFRSLSDPQLDLWRRETEPNDIENAAAGCVRGICKEVVPYGSVREPGDPLLIAKKLRDLLLSSV